MAEFEEVKIHFATLMTYKFMAEALTYCGAKDRLISFYLTKEFPDAMLHGYVETGIPPRIIKHRKRSFKENKQAYTRIRRLTLAERLEEYEKCPIETP